MTRRLARSVLGLLLAGALSLVLSFPGVASHDGNTPDVIVVAEGGTTEERKAFFPMMERTQDGELLVVFYDSPAHASQQGRIAMVRSADDGQTWSDPKVVVESKFDDRGPSIMETSDGTLLVKYFRTNWFDTGTTPPAEIDGTYVIRSEDGGKTWSDPSKIQTSMDGACEVRKGSYFTGMAATKPKILELDNGDLLAPIYGTLCNEPQWRASVVRSTDGGKTWPIESETFIPTPTGQPGQEFTEPALAQTRDGELIVMLRNQSDVFAPAYEARSQDLGETWTKPLQTDMHAHASDLLTLRNGMILHTWGDNSGEFGQDRPRRAVDRAVVARVKKDHHDWSATEPTLIYDGPPGDKGYASSVEIRPGKIFTVYYHDIDGPEEGFIGGTYTRLHEFFSPAF